MKALEPFKIVLENDRQPNMPALRYSTYELLHPSVDSNNVKTPAYIAISMMGLMKFQNTPIPVPEWRYFRSFQAFFQMYL